MPQPDTSLPYPAQPRAIGLQPPPLLPGRPLPCNKRPLPNALLYNLFL